jgi:hypothetical protein
MRQVGQLLREARVAAIYLVHGTFLGHDALGVLADVSRYSPAVANALRRWNKQILDALAGEAGNFTRPFAGEFERAIGQEAGSIPVRLFHWSGENHHLGRADGAVRLIDELASRRFPPGSRVLLWGHSHSGNVFALLTNLLGSELSARREFFERARCYYHSPLLRRVDLPDWNRVQALVCEQDNPLAGVALDLVTLGTPVRYGWDTLGYARLMHFINHRPAPGAPEYRAPFPPTTDDVLYAAHGDLIQQLGIAGTNFPPPIWQWRTCWADLRLGWLVQHDCRSADLPDRWQLGVRAHHEGDNLLVDYGSGGNIAQHLFGHAVYTRREWLLFHAEQVAKEWYT